MKKILIIASVLLFFGIVPTVFATGASASFDTVESGFVALAPIPGLTDDTTMSVVNSASLAVFFNNLYKYLIGLAAILAVIQITWAGLGIAYYHKDAVSEITNDHGKIKNALLGLVLVLSPVLVFSIINPNILNLSLNLPALNKLEENKSGNGNGNGAQVQSNVTGCTETAGPAKGTKLATCTATNENGTKTEGEMKDEAVEAAATYVQVNCPSKGGTMMGTTYSGSCTSYTNIDNPNADGTGGNNIKICSQATAIAYCSSVVTVNILQEREVKSATGYDVRITFKNFGYFGENKDFSTSCVGKGWSLNRVGGTTVVFGVVTTQEEGTVIQCPEDDKSFNDIKAGMKNYQCISTPVYCMYKP